MPASGTLLSLALCFNACAPKDAEDIVARSLNIDTSDAKELFYTDSHGGFHGDGTTCIVLKFDEDGLTEQLEDNECWNSFPLDETTTALVYGVTVGTAHIGPYLNDIELPEITDGYFCLIDRQDAEDTDLLKRASFNFTLGIYDMDTDILYYFEMDT